MSTVTNVDSVFVVIPAFNEETRITAVVNALREAGFKNCVVVNDGSTDATQAAAVASGAIVLNHVINRGQGAALQTGTAFALKNNARWIVHFDGDDQFNAGDIIPALEFIAQNNLDIVLGSRFLGTGSNIPWLKRRVILPLSRWINFVFTGLLLTDGQNGFRVLSAKAASLMHIVHDGMAHNIEIVSHIQKNSLRWKEFPVTVRYHRYGQGVKTGFKIVRDLLLAPWL